jgi:hypothetical protein
MTISGMAVRKLIAGCLVMTLAAPLSSVAAYAQQSGAPGEPAQSAPGQAQNDALAQNNAPPPAPAPLNTQNATGTNGQGTAGQQNGATPAVGTAAAPAETNAGVAASRPEGAVIAPAKQRRVRALVIKVSIVVGAAVAVGTIAALSRGSSSQPPR